MDMTGNTILVTGGTSGIGRALARALHGRGNRVVVAGRRQALRDEATAGRDGMTGMRLDTDDPAADPGLDVPAEVLELSPPYVRTGLTGPDQAVDPRGVPLDARVAEAMTLLEARDHPGGEILVDRDRERRTAERDGRCDAMFAAVDPA